MNINYPNVFQCLKGVGGIDLSGLSIPIPDFDFVLMPINCHPQRIDHEVVKMLTKSRNDNPMSFLTFFEATEERTFLWLSSTVAQDSSRILFCVRHIKSMRPYGYMGLAYGDEFGNKIEGDAIVRYAHVPIKNLMKTAFSRLISWIRDEIGISEICLRVLSDNPAVVFYQKCGFSVVRVSSLFEIRDINGRLIELREESNESKPFLSTRTLSHMRYSNCI